MGRNPKQKAKTIIPICIGIAFLAHEAIAGSNPAQIHARQSSMPIISLQAELARDADTFADDKTLVTACMDKGQAKQTCLCVTHVLKYEMTMDEYRAAIHLYKRGDKEVMEMASLREIDLTPQDISTAREMLRGLTEAQDFSERCSEARAYYRPKRG